MRGWKKKHSWAGLGNSSEAASFKDRLWDVFAVLHFTKKKTGKF